MIILRNKNKLLQLFSPEILDLIEQGKKKLGKSGKLIPYPIEVAENSSDYTPVIIDDSGNTYLWVKDSKYFKRSFKLFSRWRDVTNDLEKEVKKIYSSETMISLPSKVAKLCGNISIMIGISMGRVYELGKRKFWEIKEIEFFDHSKPWPDKEIVK